MDLKLETLKSNTSNSLKLRSNPHLKLLLLRHLSLNMPVVSQDSLKTN